MITNKVFALLSMGCFWTGSALAHFAADKFMIFAQILFLVTLILTVALVRRGIISTLDNETRTFFKTQLLFLCSPLITLGVQLIQLMSQNLVFSVILVILYIVSLSYVSFMGDP